LNILKVSAEPERIFSVLKQIVTATRSSLSQAHIEQLMMIALNSSDLSIFQKEVTSPLHSLLDVSKEPSYCIAGRA
jgi:hypothetical protein